VVKEKSIEKAKAERERLITQLLGKPTTETTKEAA
jgi:hypothetical protein